MVNRMGRSPGKPPTFDMTAKVTTDLPDVPADDGSALASLGRALSNLGGTLAGLFRRQDVEADRAAETDGRDAALRDVQAADQPSFAGGAAREAVTRSEAGAGPNRRRNPPMDAAALDAAIAAASPDGRRQPASIRHNNPGAMWPGPSSRKFGATGVEMLNDGLGQGNRIATFRSKEEGAAALFDLLDRGYAGMTLEKALTKWSGGNNPASYLRLVAAQTGLSGDTVLSRDLLRNPAVAVPLARAMAHHEAGRPFPLDSAGWEKAHGLFTAGGQASGVPLALRQDGVPGAATYNATLRQATAWRQQQGIGADIEAVIAASGDDEEKIRAGLDQALAGRLKSLGPLGQDPQTVEALTRAYAERSGPMIARARANREKGALDERRAAWEGSVATATTELERDAFALGANPEGDRIMAERIARHGVMLDEAVSAGLVDRATAGRLARPALEAGYAARVRGTFEALPGPADRMTFVDNLERRWAAGDETLKALPANRIKQLVDELRGRARGDAAKVEAQARVHRTEARRLVEDDIRSITETGQAVDFGKRGYDEARLTTILGPDDAIRWQDRRGEARAIFAATSGLDRLSEDAITERLASLEPKAGEPDYAARERVANAASARAKEVLALRRDDPATAAMTAFPDLKRLKDELKGDAPERFERLAQARLDAQEALGIPEVARQPLTRAEATALIAPLRMAEPGREPDILTAIARDVSARYGLTGDEVMRQLLRQAGVDRDMATYGARLIQDLAIGRTPSRATVAGAITARETGAADRAMTQPTFAPVFTRTPPMAAIQALIADPKLAGEFEAKYGVGTAQAFLRPAPPKAAPAGAGRTTIAPDGSEGWTPASRPAPDMRQGKREFREEFADRYKRRPQ